MSNARETEPVIRELRNRTGLSMEEMAKLLGYKGRSSFQRFEDVSKKTERPLTIEFVRKFARVVVGRGTPAIRLEDLFPLLSSPPPFGTREEKLAAYKLFGVDAPPELQRDPNATIQPVRRLPVVGNVQASYWVAAAPSLDVSVEDIPVLAIVGYPEEEQYALRVVGPSMNQAGLPEGMYAICLKHTSGLIDIPHGKIVHVERESRGQIEWTLKRLKWSGKGATLWPESDDPAFQDPIPVNDGDEDATVRVLGVVIGSFRKF